MVHGSKFTVSDLVYRKNRMNSVFDSESKPSAILCIDDLEAFFICLFSL